MKSLHYYTRTGCHLCEIMLEELLPLVRGHATIETRDIDLCHEWREKYDIRVPVVEADGRVISEYPLDHDAIHAFLAGLPENTE
jgi:hypothetical protein